MLRAFTNLSSGRFDTHPADPDRPHITRPD